MLSLRKIRSESMIIRTFGSDKEDRRSCDIVDLGVMTKDGNPLTLSVVVVPHICDPVCTQPINSSKRVYEHISGLDLADSADVRGKLEIDILIGSDYYWRLVTGRVSKGSSGPTAIETRLGWVLLGPVEETAQEEVAVNLVYAHSTHSLRVDTFTEHESLEAGLRRFWELESLGILKNEQSVYEKFTQQISFKQGRYVVHLPWKESQSTLPDNYDLCRRRLTGLLKRLNQNPELRLRYDAVIRDQQDQGIVEVVPNPAQSENGRVHYLSHHAVIRQDKQTTKLRIVYDASARTDGPSLNDCLYTGPNFGQTILDNLLRFRLHNVALVGDVEKAFLMVSVATPDRDALRFLWVKDVKATQPEITVLRFARVVFGVAASPFLLNATIDHHLEKFKSIDQPFVEKFRRSIYVDDLTTGAHDVESAYEFYIKSKVRLAEASFNMRKFATNSAELRRRINSREESLSQGNSGVSPGETHSSLNATEPMSMEQQVLGVRWDIVGDQLIFDISHVFQLMKGTQPTKRNAVSLATRFFDPLGVISPVTVRFKLLFQQLCEAKVDWDEALSGKLLVEWNSLISDLQAAEPISICRCYCEEKSDSVMSYSLQGFCDASQKAYAAVVYIQVETETSVSSRFLCAKTRVAPVKELTIPRLELLSALLLARLVFTVTRALEPEIELSDPTCYTDSQVALCWIRGKDKEWKQFVQNRVIEIRELVPISHWKHCPGTQNPADIPSRGVSPLELRVKCDLWLSGPTWLSSSENATEFEEVTILPEECLAEMKARDKEKLTVSLLSSSEFNAVIRCEDYSDLKRLLRITAYVLKFVKLLKGSHSLKPQQPGQANCLLTTEEVEAALIYWLKLSQSNLPQLERFQLWSQQFGLFQDGSGLWRCQGRLVNSEMSPSEKHPVLLDKNHHLTTLIVKDCHERVMHGGVKGTLTELRARYWLVRGRQLVKKLLFRCVTCRRFQGKPYCPPPSPPLPSFRVNEAPPFSYTGVDYAGPLYARDTVASSSKKVWICLYTCCVTRAVHLDIVPDMTSQAFIRSFKRFTSRRGFPVRILSDNAKTFKAAAKTVAAVLESAEVKRHFSDVHVRWSFNVERAPWWGGVFERMIQTTKRCLRKTIGNARLTYDELLTSVTEVEMIVNSRPLSYVSSDDIDEPLTPSRLLIGRRVLSLPDPTIGNDTGPDTEVTRDDLTRRMRHLSKTVDDFWRRWRAEYLVELREAHRHSQVPSGAPNLITVGDIVIVRDENRPRSLWKLGKVEKLMQGADGNVRAAFVRVQSGKEHSAVLKRPIQRLYPLEISEAAGGEETMESSRESGHGNSDSVTGDTPLTADPSLESSNPEHLVEPSCCDAARPRRQASRNARERIRTWIKDMN